MQTMRQSYIMKQVQKASHRIDELADDIEWD